MAGVHKAMTAVLARIGTALTAAGLAHRVLDAPTLRRILLITCGVPRVGGVTEKWTGWHSGGLVHVGFAVRAWPSNPPPGLLSQLAQVPAASVVNTAIVLRPSGSPNPGVRVLLRVACAADRVAECVTPGPRHRGPAGDQADPPRRRARRRRLRHRPHRRPLRSHAMMPATATKHD